MEVESLRSLPSIEMVNKGWMDSYQDAPAKGLRTLSSWTSVCLNQPAVLLGEVFSGVVTCYVPPSGCLSNSSSLINWLEGGPPSVIVFRVMSGLEGRAEEGREIVPYRPLPSPLLYFLQVPANSP